MATGAPSANISEQYVREAPDIEAYKLGLMKSAQALTMPTLPDYKIAGMTDQQRAAITAGQQGIGAYVPYLQSGAQNITGGAGAIGEAADILRGSDTRGQFAAAQNAYNQAAGAASGIGALSNVAGAGMGLLGQGSQDIDIAQQMAARNQSANLGESQDFLRGSAYQALNASQLGNAPQAQAAGNVSNQQVTAGNIQAAQMGPSQYVTSRDVNAGNIQAAQMGPAQQVETQSFAQPGAAANMMSPYMDAVVKAQQREAMRNAGIMGLQRNAAATKSGAFGGSRQAIENAEAERNLNTQLGDIQATGLQSAYQQAQSQFNTEQQARLAAQQANQQAGLTVGSQNLNAQQQASVQNAANQLQAQGMTAQQALQAALANQQAGLTVGSQNLNAQQQANVQNVANQLQASGMNAQQAMQAALANQGVQQQTNLSNQAMQGQYGLQGAQLGMQAAQQASNVGQALGSQQMQNTQLGQSAANLYGNLGTNQAGLAGQYANIAGQQANILGQQAQAQGAIGQGIGTLAGQQYGIGSSMAQGLGSLGTSLGNMGVQQAALGQTAQQLATNDVNNLYSLGATQQKQNQAVLDAERATQMQNAMQPYQQIAFQSDIYKGAPSTQMAVTQQASASPSPFQQVAGVGTGILGLAGAGKAMNLI